MNERRRSPAGGLIDLATQLLGQVLAFKAPADAVVSEWFRQHRRLGPRERRALAETVFNVLRHLNRWRYLATSAPLGTDARGGDGLHRRLVSLAWAGDAPVLTSTLSAEEQACLARLHALPPEHWPDAARHNLPDWLAATLRNQLAEAEFLALVEAQDRPASLDLRVNVMKGRREEVRAELAGAGIETEPTPWSPWGLRVQGHPSLTRLAAFAEGRIEVQDEGSQLLALLTEARRGDMVVDFCAGAGGKTLALGALMRNTGRLYAFDTSGHRLAAMTSRVERSGLGQVHPAQIAHERDDRVRRLTGKVDRVLVDAPCSGLGTLRRSPDLKWRLSAPDVQALSQRQASILAAAARLLKAGGRLVYATCSLLREENEDVVANFEAGHADFERLDAAEVLSRAGVNQATELTQDKLLRLWPHIHGTDGFAAAVWQRR